MAAVVAADRACDEVLCLLIINEGRGGSSITDVLFGYFRVIKVYVLSCIGPDIYRPPENIPTDAAGGY